MSKCDMLVTAETATKDNLLFDMLPAQAKITIYNSMTPLQCEAGTDIIVQGDKDARTFYVLESGSCDVFIYKSKDPAEGMKKVHQYAAARCDLYTFQCMSCLLPGHDDP